MGFKKLLLSIMLAIINFNLGFAQKKFNAYLMPTVNVKYSLIRNFSQELELESRNFIDRDDVTAKHLELSHFSTYQQKNMKFSLGLKFRVEADRNDENELRLIQQYEWKRNADALLSHRLRAEERIYRSIMKLRARYRIRLNLKPEKFADNIYISNEFVIETNENEEIEYENRLAVEAGWDFSKKSAFVTGLQYRLSDFTNVGVNNLFLTAGLEFNL